MRDFYPNQPPKHTVMKPPSPPLGPVLTTLREDDLASSPDLYEYSAGIIDCEDIASYNWLNDKAPTILVPGLHALSPHLIILGIMTCKDKERETDSRKRKAAGLDHPDRNHKAQGRRRELLS